MGEQVTTHRHRRHRGHLRHYLDHLGKLPGVDVVAVADLDVARAQAIADQHPRSGALSPDDLYAADDVDIVLNLTIPAAHAAVHQAALAGGQACVRREAARRRPSPRPSRC